MDKRSSVKFLKNIFYSWKTIVLRIIANINVIILLVISAYAVITVVQRSEEQHNGDWWRRNETTIVMSLISFIFPMLFELVGLIEYYHPRMQLRLQLARIMILNLLNLYSLIWAQFSKIAGMLERMQVILEDLGNKTKTSTIPVTLTTSFMASSTTPQHVQVSSEAPIKTEFLSTTTSTIKLMTEMLVTKFADLITSTESSSVSTLSSSTESFTEIPEYSDLTDPDYFEVENVTFTQNSPQFNDSGIFYDEFGNWTSNLITNVTGDLFANLNISDIVNNLTTFIASTSTAASFSSTTDGDFAYYDQYDSSDNETLQNNMIQSKLQHDLPDFRLSLNKANETLQKELRTLCWETMFGQGKET